MFYIDNNVVGHVKIPSTKPGSDRTGPDRGSDRGPDHIPDHGSDHGKTKPKF